MLVLILISIWDGVYNHCGTDVLIWSTDENGLLRISEIHSYQTPNRKKGIAEYRDLIEAYMNQLLDAWHKAAAEANFDDYFDFMADDFYFLGTDPGERWSKEQFANFCRPHFKTGEAWSFTPFERNYYISDDLETVWFDEKLGTWMEECRGSGVIELGKLTDSDDGKIGVREWKLKHYNLTVTIENEKIEDFIKLRKKK